MCSNKGNDIFKDSYYHIGDQAKKAMFSLRKIKSGFGKLCRNLALKAFDNLILPILKYGGEILFTGKKIDEYEKNTFKFP